jgi:MYXO-CTERM domain-containing protein
MAKADAATDIAFAPRGKIQVPMMVFKDIPEIGVVQGVALPLPPPSQLPMPSGGGGTVQQKPQGCGCDSGGAAGGTLFGLGVIVFALRRRRA